jgi:hypothetical protein
VLGILSVPLTSLLDNLLRGDVVSEVVVERLQEIVESGRVTLALAAIQ